MNWKKILLIAVAAFTITTLYFPLKDSNDISLYSGPILDDNWFSALNWIKNNTPECSIIATYWDPGHFITGIADRPVIFDGASQNSQRTLVIPGHLSEEQIKEAAVIENYIVSYETINGTEYTKITTARIQDIGNSLLTSNESLAIKILQKYNKPNEKCQNYSIYYLASNDLLGKSQWWTYFGTWSPVNHTGAKYYYWTVQLSVKKPILSDNSTAYVYPLSRSEQFVVYESNSSLSAFYQQGSNLMRVNKLFFFSGQFGYLMTANESELEGMLWVSPDMETAIYIPPELENSMFTQMYLFNGQGLSKYTMVGNFGGEVKLFYVNITA